MFEIDELNNFIINHLEYYNKYKKDYDNDKLFKIGQYGCIFEDENIKGKDLPRVIEGEGFGIIEDCGGTCGLEDIKKAFKTKKGERYEAYSNWLGK